MNEPNVMYSFSAIKQLAMYDDLLKVIRLKFIDVCDSCHKCIFCGYINHTCTFCLIMQKYRTFGNKIPLYGPRTWIVCNQKYLYGPEVIVVSHMTYDIKIDEKWNNRKTIETPVAIELSHHDEKASYHFVSSLGTELDGITLGDTIRLRAGFLINETSGVHYNISFGNMYEN